GRAPNCRMAKAAPCVLQIHRARFFPAAECRKRECAKFPSTRHSHREFLSLLFLSVPSVPSNVLIGLNIALQGNVAKFVFHLPRPTRASWSARRGSQFRVRIIFRAASTPAR